MRIMWVGDVACTGRTEMHTEVSRGTFNEKAKLEDPGIHGRLTMKLISTQQDERPVTGSVCHGRVASGGLLRTRYTEP